MKKTPSIQIFIEEKVAKYCKQLSINRPTILTKTRQIKDLPKDMTRGRRTSAYKYYGVSYISYNTVFLNVRKITNRKSLDNTIRHELVHMRFPYLSHGLNFYEKVKQLKKGKTWESSKSKYLDKFGGFAHP